MRLTQFTDYSLRVLLLVATAPGGQASVGEVARAFGISRHHLVKVAGLLGRQGLLASVRGRGGGLRLALPPSAINLGRVVRATEGESLLAECFEPGSSLCAISGACRLSRVLREALASFYLVLDSYSLQDLLEHPAELVAILHRRDFRERDAVAEI
jgi:Rrf2 family nitric oxide-sensitive transcriptional repressor